MVAPPSPQPAVFFVDHERLQRRANGEMSTLIAPKVAAMRGSFGRLLGTIPDDGARQTELADGLWITKQSLGERLRALEDRGWISIEPDPDDRRARIVRRTPEGDRIRALTEVAMAEMEAGWAAEVGAERYRTFRAVLAELSRGA
ncbi:MAG: Transcriptional regulator, MarR family [Ilumatobacteraceae bacterium]|nr:Transcriptional regulator, MarR family [Ilumatobacteraceae bacterium]